MALLAILIVVGALGYTGCDAVIQRLTSPHQAELYQPYSGRAASETKHQGKKPDATLAVAYRAATPPGKAVSKPEGAFTYRRTADGFRWTADTKRLAKGGPVYVVVKLKKPDNSGNTKEKTATFTVTRLAGDGPPPVDGTIISLTFYGYLADQSAGS